MNEKELTPQERAQITRQQNTQARTNRYEEQTLAIHAARLALERVTDDPNATAEQILQAAQLMVEIGKRY